MVLAENVERPVNNESQQLLTGRDPLCARILARDFGADVNVANHRAALPRAIEPERYHVGRSMVPEVATIELGHCGSPDERY
jgi:hypothetical protein